VRFLQLPYSSRGNIEALERNLPFSMLAYWSSRIKINTAFGQIAAMAKPQIKTESLYVQFAVHRCFSLHTQPTYDLTGETIIKSAEMDWMGADRYLTRKNIHDRPHMHHVSQFSQSHMLYVTNTVLQMQKAEMGRGSAIGEGQHVLLTRNPHRERIADLFSEGTCYQNHE
ncbi:hypothetical protein STEG23_035783, partial [Scotinomys teguina]